MQWFYFLLFRKCLGIPEPFLLLSSQYTPFSLELSFVCLPQLRPIPLNSLTFEYPISSSREQAIPVCWSEGMEFVSMWQRKQNIPQNRTGRSWSPIGGVCLNATNCFHSFLRYLLSGLLVPSNCKLQPHHKKGSWVPAQRRAEEGHPHDVFTWAWRGEAGFSQDPPLPGLPPWEGLELPTVTVTCSGGSPRRQRPSGFSSEQFQEWAHSCPEGVLLASFSASSCLCFVHLPSWLCGMLARRRPNIFGSLDLSPSMF